MANREQSPGIYQQWGESKHYRANVGLALFSKAGHVFVGRRVNGRGAFQWQMPQGGIDEGEDPREAALRELCEETGVTADLVTVEAQLADWVNYDLPHDLVPKLWKGRYRGQAQMWFLMRFHGRDDQISIETDEPEFSEWTWADSASLVDRIVPFKRHIYAQVVSEFSTALAR